MSLVIDDAYIDTVKNFLMSQCDGLNSLLTRYVREMNAVIEMGIMDGATSDALKEFLSQVESKFDNEGSNPGNMVDEVERYCIDFVKAVDEADKGLYEEC